MCGSVVVGIGLLHLLHLVLTLCWLGLTFPALMYICSYDLVVDECAQ